MQERIVIYFDTIRDHVFRPRPISLPIKTYDNNLAALDTQIVLYTLQLENLLLIWNYGRNISYQLLSNLQSNHFTMFVGKGKL